MDLEYDPLFCVEQIQIPPALPDILKGFAKEAIRCQPPCLHEFAIAYFQRLLALKHLDASAPPPTLKQLQQVWSEVKDHESMRADTLREICSSRGIGSVAFTKVFQLIEFPADPVDPKEIIVLLVATAATSFAGVIDGLFKVVAQESGGEMPTPLFFKVLFFLGKRDRDLTPQTLSDLSKDFVEMRSVTYGDIATSPHMRRHFR